MTIHINTEYCGNNRYIINVIQDGKILRAYGATVGTVGRMRNRLIDNWVSQLADEVVAGEIPEATDIRTKGHAL